MEEAFWLMWKTATPLLALATILLMARLSFERGIHREDINKLRHKNIGQGLELERLKAELVDANGIVETLRNRAHQTGCPCAELTAAQAQIEHLTARNNQLTFDALSNNVRYIKVNRN